MRDRGIAAPLAALVDRQMTDGGPPGPAPPAHAAGRLAALRGDPRRALQCFAAARSAAERTGARGVAALVQLDAAAVSGAPALDAVATFQRLGMRGWAARSAPAGVTPGAAPAAPAGLTPREGELLRLLAAGRTSQEIARELVVALATVNRHIANIYVKIGARNRAEATAFAIAHGMHSSVQQPDG